MKIIIPKLSTANAICFCRDLTQYEPADTYFFDVSDINNYEPLPMLLTSAAIRQFCKERELLPRDIRLRYNDNADYHYACHMGYFQAAGFMEGKAPGEASGSTTYIPITKLDIRELQQKAILSGDYLAQGDIIEKESKRLSIILAQGNRQLQQLLQYLIREAIRNIPEHADTYNVWICGQFWRNRSIAEIAILDEGIGVFQSLKKNRIHREYIASNEEALRWAVKPGVSAAFTPATGQKDDDPWANSGYGLFMISEICKYTRGWFTFVSGDDCLRIYNNDSGVYATHFNGTALGIRINTSNIHNYQEIIDTVRKNGEQTAKDIKNAFKKASTPSRGLIY